MPADPPSNPLSNLRGPSSWMNRKASIQASSVAESICHCAPDARRRRRVLVSPVPAYRLKIRAASTNGVMPLSLRSSLCSSPNPHRQQIVQRRNELRQLFRRHPLRHHIVGQLADIVGGMLQGRDIVCPVDRRADLAQAHPLQRKQILLRNHPHQLPVLRHQHMAETVLRATSLELASERA